MDNVLRARWPSSSGDKAGPYRDDSRFPIPDRAILRSEITMDPICHTLVGANLAETGLKSRTALGTATLVIAANAPDIDVFSYSGGPYAALACRRGVTHGVLAWIVLPVVITGLILVWDRLVRRRGRRTPPHPVLPKQIFLLALAGVLTHPVLDLLNTYGIRLLMPFSGHWFYGDTLFIADPWVWGVLALGF